MIGQASSYSERVTATCAQCGKTYGFAAWFLIDADANPELAAMAMQEGLRHSRCPDGHTGYFDVPQIMRLAGVEPEYVYFPRAGASRDDMERQYCGLLSVWKDVGGPTVADCSSNYEACCIVPIHRIDELASAADHWNELAGAPPRFFPLFLEAKEAEQAYRRSNDEATSHALVAAWESVVRHPRFASSPLWFRRAALAELGGARFRRSSAVGQTLELHEAIARFEQALALSPFDPGKGYGLLFNLGIALNARERASRDAAEFADGTDKLVEAIGFAGDDPRFGGLLRHAAGALIERADATDSLDDADHAISLLRRALTCVAADSPTAPRIAMDLSNGLQLRFRFAGDSAALDEAVTSAKRAVASVEHDPVERAKALNTLGCALETRYWTASRARDLGMAISNFRKASKLASRDPEHRARCLSNLANVLRARYARDARIADLEEASRAARLAVDTMPPKSPGAAKTIGNWASAIRDLYRVDQGLSGIDRAIAAFRHVQDLIAAGGGDAHATVAGNLGAALLDRYQKTSDPADLEASIDVLEGAVKLARAGTELPDALGNLGTALIARCNLGAHDADLDRAIKMFTQALDVTAQTAVTRPQLMLGLAFALALRSDRRGDPDDAMRAGELYAEIPTIIGNRDAGLMLRATRAWASFASRRNRWEEARNALRLSMAALERVLVANPDRRGKTFWLQQLQTLGAQAAYAFAKCGDARGAIVALENARARLLREMMGRDSADLAQLEVMGHGNLRRRYSEIRSQIEAAVIGERVGTLAEVSVLGRAFAYSAVRGVQPYRDEYAAEFVRRFAERSAHQYRELVRCEDEIRRVPGFERFLEPLRWDDVAANLFDATDGGAAPAAVVYFCVAESGGVALVATRDDAFPVWVAATASEVAEWLSGRDADDPGYRAAQHDSAAMARILPGLLASIGRDLVAPVACALARRDGIHAAAPGAPLVVLIPTGLLSELPLYAATYSIDRRERALGADFAIAYGLASAVWKSCGERLAALVTAPQRMLAVGNPQPLPDEWPSLASAALEASLVSGIFDGSLPPLCEREATLDRVEGAMKEASYLHFACHGEFNPRSPLESRLILANGDGLTVARLMNTRSLEQGRSRLCVLSACETAMVDLTEMPEEPLGFAPVLLAAGVPGVIASLWVVDDEATLLLMARFYELHVLGDRELGTGPLPPVRALRAAQLWVRDFEKAQLDRLETAARERPYWSFVARIRDSVTSMAGERPFESPLYWAPFAFYGR